MEWTIASLVAWWLLRKPSAPAAPAGTAVMPPSGSGLVGGTTGPVPSTGTTPIGTVQTTGQPVVLPGYPPAARPGLATKPWTTPAVPAPPARPGSIAAPVTREPGPIAVQPVAPATVPPPALVQPPSACSGRKLPPPGWFVLLPPRTNGATNAIVGRATLQAPNAFTANGYTLVGLLLNPSGPGDAVEIAFVPFPSAQWDEVCSGVPE